MAPSALHGVKVLDLTHHIAGPYCTKLLADFGAQVIKIERRGGDPAREMPPFYHDENHPQKSPLFLYLNTAKRSVTLNLTSDRGIHILRELAKAADILVENFSPRVMPSLEVDFPILQALNPALVMVSISNFGQTGPYRDYKATDMVEYALGGLMYIFGSYDREPLKHAFNQAQFKAGTNAAAAALMALYHQRRTGRGQHIDVSIQESVASALRDVTSNFTYFGAVRRRQPNHSGDLTRLRAVSDGYILPNPGIGGRLNWNTVVEFLEAPELDDEKFRTPTARLENAEELGEILDQLFLSKNKMNMFYRAHEKRFIYGVINSPQEVMTNPQNLAREGFVEVDHPVAGTFSYPGAPFKLSETPWDGLHPAPSLGQHTEEVLSQHLGYTAAGLEEMSGMGVI